MRSRPLPNSGTTDGSAWRRRFMSSAGMRSMPAQRSANTPAFARLVAAVFSAALQLSFGAAQLR